MCGSEFWKSEQTSGVGPHFCIVRGRPLLLCEFPGILLSSPSISLQEPGLQMIVQDIQLLLCTC